MAWWKQIVLALLLLAGAALVWARFVPAFAPILAQLGFEPAEGAAPAPAARPRVPGRRARGPTRVIGVEVTQADANGRVSAIGDGRALHSVSVLPLAPGRLTSIDVASGDRVTVGAVIARLDSDSEVIALDRSELAVADAEVTVARVAHLMRTEAATEVQLREAQLALDNARLEVRDATLALERRDITAPIAGVIGILPVDPGSQVGTDTEIATIDDRSRIVVDFRVPERFAGRLSVGDRIAATALSRPELELHGEISALDSRVDSASRTLRVQAALDNAEDLLRGGMAFAVELAFAGDTYPAVDPLAIQWGAEGAYVWAGRDGRAARVPVRIVQRNSDTVLVAGALQPGERVVTEGLQRLREGAEIAFEDEAGPDPRDISRAGAPASGG